MIHHPFCFIQKKDYSSTFDLPYKDLVITYESFTDVNKTIYIYEIQVNHLTQHTGIIDYDTARELFAIAWGGKVKEENAAQRMKEMIMDYLRATGTNNVGMLDEMTMRQLENIRKIELI